MCEYHRNSVWYVDDMEMSTDICTLGYNYDADECPHFEEIRYEEIDYEYLASGGWVGMGKELLRINYLPV